MHGIGRRPSVPDRIEADPMAFVDALHKEYQACQKGYKEERRDLLQQCGFLALRFKEKEVFEKLVRHPFWEESRQKPKRNGHGKWAVYMMLRPKSEAQKKIASKYGLALDVLFAGGISPEDFSDTLKAWGGIGVTAARHRGTNATANNKHAPKTAGRSKRPDDEAGDIDQDEEYHDETNSAVDQAEEEDSSLVKKRPEPGMKRSRFPEDNVIRSEAFSRKLKDDLFVMCSEELMAEALTPR